MKEEREKWVHSCFYLSMGSIQFITFTIIITVIIIIIITITTIIVVQIIINKNN